MFPAAHWHVRSVEQTILRGGEKIPKHTMAWIYRTRTSITKSSLSRSLDHLEDPLSKEFGGSRQSSLLLRLSRSISMLPTECSTQEASSSLLPIRRKRRSQIQIPEKPSTLLRRQQR